MKIIKYVQNLDKKYGQSSVVGVEVKARDEVREEKLRKKMGGTKGNGKSHKMSSFTSAKRKGLIWV